MASQNDGIRLLDGVEKMQVESHCLHHLANLNKMQDTT